MDINRQMQLYYPGFMDNNKQMKPYYPGYMDNNRQMKLYYPVCIDNKQINEAVLPWVYGQMKLYYIGVWTITDK